MITPTFDCLETNRLLCLYATDPDYDDFVTLDELFLEEAGKLVIKVLGTPTPEPEPEPGQAAEPEPEPELEPGRGAEEGEPSPMAALRAELSVLKVRALTKRAEAVGVSEESLGTATERSDIVELIVAKAAQTAAEESARVEALMSELSGMKIIIRALTMRAEMGVDEAKLDEADTTADLIRLIVAASSSGGAEADCGSAQSLFAAAQSPDKVLAPIATDGHGNASAAVAPLAAGAPDPAVKARQLFGSMRFKNGGILPEARLLQAELARHAAVMHIIDTSVFTSIENCDTFLVVGTAAYGEDTGNQASTFYESKYAHGKQKRIILIRMIPFGQEFEQLQGRVMFGMNKLCLHWPGGEPMPLTMVGDVLKAINDPTTAPPPAA